MEFALVDGSKTSPFSGGRGVCPQCGAAMVAKCGARKVHHWAHQGRCNGDPWWENETEWHRSWKALFPPECREISHTDPCGEIHRADIKTPNGIVVEVQNSPMSDMERISRETFYGNLVWVLNGSSFRKNFDVYHPLPDPDSDWGRDLIWAKAARHQQGANRGIFYRLSENRKRRPELTKATCGPFGFMNFLQDFKVEIARTYQGQHQYDWVRPRATWLDAACPVYIDFGEDQLLRLEQYDETGLRCVRRVSKQTFLQDLMTQSYAQDVAVKPAHDGPMTWADRLP